MSDKCKGGPSWVSVVLQGLSATDNTASCKSGPQPRPQPKPEEQENAAKLDYDFPSLGQPGQPARKRKSAPRAPPKQQQGQRNEQSSAPGQREFSPRRQPQWAVPEHTMQNRGRGAASEFHHQPGTTRQWTRHNTLKPWQHYHRQLPRRMGPPPTIQELLCYNQCNFKGLWLRKNNFKPGAQAILTRLEPPLAPPAPTHQTQFDDEKILFGDDVKLSDSVRGLQFLGPPLEPLPGEQSSAKPQAQQDLAPRGQRQRQRPNAYVRHMVPVPYHVAAPVPLSMPMPYRHARPHRLWRYAVALAKVQQQRWQMQRSHLHYVQKLRKQIYRLPLYRPTEEQQHKSRQRRAAEQMRRQTPSDQPEPMSHAQDIEGLAMPLAGVEYDLLDAHFANVSPRERLPAWFAGLNRYLDWEPLYNSRQMWNPLLRHHSRYDPTCPPPPPGFEHVEPRRNENDPCLANYGKKLLSTRARKLMGEMVKVVPHMDYPTPNPMASPHRVLKEQQHFVGTCDTHLSCQLPQLSVVNGATGDGYYVCCLSDSSETLPTNEQMAYKPIYTPGVTYWDLLGRERKSAPEAAEREEQACKTVEWNEGELPAEQAKISAMLSELPAGVNKKPAADESSAQVNKIIVTVEPSAVVNKMLATPEPAAVVEPAKISAAQDKLPDELSAKSDLQETCPVGELDRLRIIAQPDTTNVDKSLTCPNIDDSVVEKPGNTDTATDVMPTSCDKIDASAAAHVNNELHQLIDAKTDDGPSIKVIVEAAKDVDNTQSDQPADVINADDGLPLNCEPNSDDTGSEDELWYSTNTSLNEDSNDGTNISNDSFHNACPF